MPSVSKRIRKSDLPVSTIRKLALQEIARSGASSETNTANPSSGSFVNIGISAASGTLSGVGGIVAYALGTVVTPSVPTAVVREKIKAVGMVFLQDDLADDAVKITADVLNSPMFWLN